MDSENCRSDLSSDLVDSISQADGSAKTWAVVEDGVKILTVADLMARVAEFESRLGARDDGEGRDIDQAILSGYRQMLEDRVAAFDAALQDALPGLQEEIERELAKKNDMRQQAHVLGLSIEGLGYPPHQMRVISGKIRVRSVTYSVVPAVNDHEQTEVLGALSPSGQEDTAQQWQSKQGAVVSEGLGPVDWVLAAWGVVSALRGLGRLALRVVSTRLPQVRLALRRQWFAQPTLQTSPYLGAGRGYTDEFGNATISSQGTPTEQRLVLAHEYIHSWLSPRFLPFRNLRADLSELMYERSELLRYTEEALAETYAQLKVHGKSLNSLIVGLRYPMEFAEYRLTWGVVAAEAFLGVTIGTIMVGGTAVTVHLVMKSRRGGAKPQQRRGLGTQ
jgi:hypothetical protein